MRAKVIGRTLLNRFTGLTGPVSSEYPRAVQLLLFTALLQWLALFSVESPLAPYAFFLGPFLGVGIMISTLVDIPRRPVEFTFFTVVNATLVCLLVGVISVVLHPNLFHEFTFLAIFAGLYICLLLLTDDKIAIHESHREIGRPDATTIKYALLCVATLLTCLLAPRFIATGEMELFSVAAYLSILSLAVLRFASENESEVADALTLVTIGLGLIWLRVYATNGIFLGDGRITLRYAEIALTRGLSVVPDIRVADMATVRYLLPSLSILSGAPVESVVKWVIPILSATSVLGLFVVVRSWFSRRTAIAIAFVFAQKQSFYEGLPMNLRSTFALLFMFGFFALVLHERRGYERRGWKPILIVLYLLSVVITHDTVGLVLALTLVAYSSFAIVSVLLHDARSQTALATVNYTVLVVAVYYGLYRTEPSFHRVTYLVTYIVLDWWGLRGQSYDTQQTVSAGLSSLGSHLADWVFIGSVFIEVILMVVGTALVGLYWQSVIDLPETLKQYEEKLREESLLLAGSAVFAVLIATGKLAARRTYLYLGPLVAPLAILALLHTDCIGKRFDLGRFRIKPSTILVCLFIAFTFVNQIGLLYYLTSASGTAGSHLGVKSVDTYHYTQTDVSTRAWLGTHIPDGTAVYGDYFSRQFLRSEIRLSIADLRFIKSDISIRDATSTGCVYLRSHNLDSRTLFINEPGIRIREFSERDLTRSNTVYATTDSRVLC